MRSASLVQLRVGPVETRVADRFGDSPARVLAEVVFDALPIGAVGFHSFTFRADLQGSVGRGDLLEGVVEFFGALQQFLLA